jgi:flavin reductase (DIM6/NTAB) family NADH-FMN oxidoreductase RutF
VTEAHPKLREIDPADSPSADIYALMTGVVVPRPIAFVSSLSPTGVANLAPFSFFNAGGANPPSVVFSPITSHGGSRQGHAPQRARHGGVRRAHRALVHPRPHEPDLGEYGPEVDEFEVAGLTKAPSVKVKPWRAAECPIAMECRLFKIVEHGEGRFARIT